MSTWQNPGRSKRKNSVDLACGLPFESHYIAPSLFPISPYPDTSVCWSWWSLLLLIDYAIRRSSISSKFWEYLYFCRWGEEKYMPCWETNHQEWVENRLSGNVSCTVVHQDLGMWGCLNACLNFPLALFPQAAATHYPPDYLCSNTSSQYHRLSTLLLLGLCQHS